MSSQHHNICLDPALSKGHQHKSVTNLQMLHYSVSWSASNHTCWLTNLNSYIVLVVVFQHPCHVSQWLEVMVSSQNVSNEACQIKTWLYCCCPTNVKWAYLCYCLLYLLYDLVLSVSSKMKQCAIFIRHCDAILWCSSDVTT